jgi:hypothetical protein
LGIGDEREEGFDVLRLVGWRGRRRRRGGGGGTEGVYI